MDICAPRPVSSENRTRGWPADLSLQVSPVALANSRRGCPPSTGTTQVSIVFASLANAVEYPMRAPSGENLGLILSEASFVSCTGSPSGRSLT